MPTSGNESVDPPLHPIPLYQPPAEPEIRPGFVRASHNNRRDATRSSTTTSTTTSNAGRSFGRLAKLNAALTSDRANLILAFVVFAFIIAGYLAQLRSNQIAAQSNEIAENVYYEQLWKDCRDRPDIQNTSTCRTMQSVQFDSLTPTRSNHISAVKRALESSSEDLDLHGDLVSDDCPTLCTPVHFRDETLSVWNRRLWEPFKERFTDLTFWRFLNYLIASIRADFGDTVVDLIVATVQVLAIVTAIRTTILKTTKNYIEHVLWVPWKRTTDSSGLILDKGGTTGTTNSICIQNSINTNTDTNGVVFSLTIDRNLKTEVATYKLENTKTADTLPSSVATTTTGTISFNTTSVSTDTDFLRTSTTFTTSTNTGSCSTATVVRITTTSTSTSNPDMTRTLVSMTTFRTVVLRKDNTENRELY